MNDSLNLKFDVGEGGALVAEGTYTAEEQEDNAYTSVVASFTVKIEVVAFTREEVLTKLYEQSAAAAKVFGPYSSEVDELDDDINDVKGGASLSTYTWLFE